MQHPSRARAKDRGSCPNGAMGPPLVGAAGLAWLGSLQVAGLGKTETLALRNVEDGQQNDRWLPLFDDLFLPGVGLGQRLAPVPSQSIWTYRPSPRRSRCSPWAWLPWPLHVGVRARLPLAAEAQGLRVPIG